MKNEIKTQLCGFKKMLKLHLASLVRYLYMLPAQVSTTRALPLEWPDFACSFNHLVRLRLVRRPESVKVAIYSCSGVPWWPDQVRACRSNLP